LKFWNKSLGRKDTVTGWIWLWSNIVKSKWNSNCDGDFITYSHIIRTEEIVNDTLEYFILDNILGWVSKV
jgi:hypothetical protein